MSKREDTQEKIISAAEKVFAQKGFYQAHIRDIEREAGVAEKKFYSFFSKDEALVFIFERISKNINQLVENSIKENTGTVDTIEKLARILLVILKFFEENDNWKTIFIENSRQLRELGKTLMGGGVRKLVQTIESILTEGQERGIFRKDLTPKSMQRILLGSVEEFLHSWTLKETVKYKTETSRQQLEKAIDIILFAFLSEKTRQSHQENTLVELKPCLS